MRARQCGVGGGGGRTDTKDAAAVVGLSRLGIGTGRTDERKKKWVGGSGDDGRDGFASAGRSKAEWEWDAKYPIIADG